MIGRLLGMVMSRTLWVLVGLLALCYVIWVAGAALAINQWYPLESAQARITLIALILGFYLLRIVWRKWREGRLNAQLLRQLRRPSKNTESAQQKTPENVEVQALNKRFDEAIELLKNTKFAQSQDKAWLGRFSQQHVYQLPWYMFIGAPGSGKTTALVNAGLTFPLADTFGKTALKGVGGTRNCDWWFTDEAVLLDTAGRYTTHESDPTGDEEEWTGFLSLLSKYRGRQPINGIILTISLADLLSANDTDRIQHAAVLRQRLGELKKQLGIHFPVYVLVTKMDLLTGFEPYFSSFDRSSLEQVWGFSFAYEQSQQASFDLLGQYQQEFARLQQRLDDGLADVLAQTATEEQRAKAFLLPQQFESIQDLLGYFLTEVFASSKFEPGVSPRGVYFSSGTQGGMGFDPVTAQLGQELDLGLPSTTTGVGGTEGKSYFLHRLLKDVVFKEAGLAGLNIKWEQRYRRLQWLGYGLSAVALAVLLSWWWVSYQNNKQYLAQVAEKIPVLDRIGAQTTIERSTEVLALMPFFNANWDVAAGDGFYPPQRPWGYSAGLYQGNKIQSASQTVYDKQLDQSLWPQVAQVIETALAQAPAHDLEQRYEALRAYLMMYDAQRYDAVFLKGWVLRQLQQALPPDYTRAQYERLAQHIDRLLSRQVMHSPFAKNETLVKQAREQLDQYGLAERIYSRLLRLYGSTEIKDSSLVSLAGAEATTIFERNSLKPLNEGVPGLFSYNGYWNVFSKKVEEVATQLHMDDDWILGVNQRKQQPRLTVITEVQRLYFVDYVKHWDAFLADVRLRTPRNLIDAIELSRSVSATNSPLGRFIKNVAFETTLLREDQNYQRSIIDRAKDRVSSSSQSLEQMFGPIGLENAVRVDSSPTRLEQMVDRHFVRYHELANQVNPNTPAPIDSTLQLLNELYTYLTAADSALRSQNPLPPADVLSKLQAESGRMPDAVGGMLDQLAGQAAMNVNRVRQQQVGEDVNAVLGSYCRRTIAGRYPFSKSKTDVAPNDFARFFGPQQMMDQFFDQELSRLVDRSGTQMRFKPGIDGVQGEAARYLRSFEQAGIIRDVFFAAGRMEPSFRVAVRIVDMDASISQISLDIDGQVIHYAHGPQVATTVQWPGERGSNQVVLSVMPQQGASGLSTMGPWALHRLLDQASSVRRGRSPEITEATFHLNGRYVTVEFRAYSALSPFQLPELTAFSCPGKG
ncbi:type VI secretion system membrane subunit TssM [Paenalcaligenes faecalis]|uniref:type VI secretion system membrane subunit TssM n=1 Tax=Paenalcaligenes faecalis TaxID=2980099 RepID=UPI0022B9C34C|nr:type VI secretion system membrane subunit TssM [Paenalcaligenes faecalis]